MMRKTCSILVLAMYEISAQPIQWSHGAWDQDGAPAGKLLSENNGYWGDSVLTGVEYRYLSEPTNPPDILRGDSNTFGRRLLDRRFGGDWHVQVGQNNGPLLFFSTFSALVFTEVTSHPPRWSPSFHAGVRTIRTIVMAQSPASRLTRRTVACSTVPRCQPIAVGVTSS